MVYDYKNIIEAIEEFSINLSATSKISSLINSSLNIFGKFPNTLFASLYLMNEESYEFEHKATYPEEYKYEAENYLDLLVENGIIGETLANKAISFFPNDTSIFYDLYYISIPLIGSKGPIGLVVMAINVAPSKIGNEFFAYCNIIARLASYSLENAFLKYNEKRTKGAIAQQVASRTLDLLQSKKKLFDKIEHLQSDLSMSIPHEVRTPINQILGFSDFLKKHIDSTETEEAVEMLTDIHSSAVRLKRLFENYVLYANLSVISTNVNEIFNLQKKVTPSAQSIVFDAVAAAAMNNDRYGDLETEYVDAPIYISEEFFKKVVDELIDNSIKYSKKGTKIEIKTELENDLYNLTFKDYGSGLTEGQINEVGAYVQFDRKINEQQGSGLGLSIVRRIVDLHNGDFNITSEKNKFTEIKISFKIATDFTL